VGRLRVAVLSDVHSNLPALEAVLESIEDASAEEIWCLGDLVGYGADPDSCTALIRDRCEISLLGNHDLAVLDELDVSSFSDTAKAAVEWTQARIARETVSYLRGLGPALYHEGFGLFHASPRDPIWEYVLTTDQAEAGLDAQEDRIGLIGHSHVALYFSRDENGPRPGYAQGAQAPDGALIDISEGGWLVNPGSVGQPRDGDPRAAWLELETEELTARFHRVPYDIEAASRAIIDGGLPTSLGERLKVGR
jgi:diadenosine tetraphosphatase ApaH/serine/threonine PP2A family protein phosphatase